MKINIWASINRIFDFNISHLLGANQISLFFTPLQKKKNGLKRLKKEKSKKCNGIKICYIYTDGYTVHARSKSRCHQFGFGFVIQLIVAAFPVYR